MKKFSILLAFLLLFTLSACSDDAYLDGGRKDDDQTELLYLTMTEVSEFDGKDGNLAYIVVQGVIYDVTDEWNNGEHNGVMAGTDATDAIMGAPHGESVLENLDIVGNIVDEQDVLVDYTLIELEAFDGKDGNMGYIAVNGVIYDVTDEWNNGEHNGVMAGTDATSAFSSSPHSQSTLDSLVIIGNVIEVVDNTVYFTLTELATYNGKDGNMGYIAVNGIVYDVTDEWNNGEHKGVMAGTDATTAFSSSPHSQSTLDGLDIVGEISE